MCAYCVVRIAYQIEKATRDEPLLSRAEINQRRMSIEILLRMSEGPVVATSKINEIAEYSPEYWRDYDAKDRVWERMRSFAPEFWDHNPAANKDRWLGFYRDACFYRENFRRIAAGMEPF